MPVNWSFASGVQESSLPGFVAPAQPSSGLSLPGFTETLGGGTPRRGVIHNPVLGIHIVFQYNPESITEEKELDWTEYPIQGLSEPLLVFSCGRPRVLRFKVLFDAHSSPHPDGHIANDLQAIRYLTVPFDVDGTPTVKLPEYPPTVSASAFAPYLFGFRPPTGLGGLMGNVPSLMDNSFTGNRYMGKKGPSERIGGVPPLVKIAYGGLVRKGVVRSVRIQEILHGTTPQAAPQCLPTRAWVEFEFLVIEDYRMLVHFKNQEPGAG